MERFRRHVHSNLIMFYHWKTIYMETIVVCSSVHPSVHPSAHPPTYLILLSVIYLSHILFLMKGLLKIKL